MGTLRVYGPNGRLDAVQGEPEPVEPTAQVVQTLRLTGVTEDVQVTNVRLLCWDNGAVTWEPL